MSYTNGTKEDLTPMFYIHIERRLGSPFFYLERYTEYDGCTGGTFATMIVGLPLVHIEISLLRAISEGGDSHDQGRKEKITGTTESHDDNR